MSLGLPGSLPVLNEAAVELAIRVGLALHCEIRPSVFARKNYFYPDMPKDFQISQYDQPHQRRRLARARLGGARVGITRAHLEEDTGKSTHQGGSGRIHGAEYSLVDYNRAGVPLLEIVSEPDLRSAEEARAYVEELRAILVAIGASDGKLEEGSLRVDANVSVRRPGEPARHPLRDQERQLAALAWAGPSSTSAPARSSSSTRGERVRQQTRHWDEAVGAHPARAGQGELRGLPLLPRARPGAGGARPGLGRGASAGAADAAGRATGAAGRGRRVERRGSPPWPSPWQRGLDELAVAAIEAGADPARVLTHVEHNLAVDGRRPAVRPERLAALVRMEVGRRADGHPGQDGPGRPGGRRRRRRPGRAGPRPGASRRWGPTPPRRSSTSSSPSIPAEWQRFVEGDARPSWPGFFVGRAMKATSGKADGRAVTALLQRRAG